MTFSIVHDNNMYVIEFSVIYLSDIAYFVFALQKVFKYFCIVSIILYSNT